MSIRDHAMRSSSTTARKPIRVVIVDDSPTVRVALSAMLAEDPGFEVIGTARDGDAAVELVASRGADLVTMDISMPGLGGLDATRRIMATHPTPIVIVSGIPGIVASDLSFDAISAGAVDVIAKPDRAESYRDPAVRRRLLDHLRNMARVAVVGRRGKTSEVAPRPAASSRARLIAIGGSTGAPPVLTQILGAVSASSPPVLVVQHMESSFLASFAAWLDRHVPARVVIAESGAAITPGTVYVAPGDVHLEVGPSGVIRLTDAPPIGFHRPSVEPLFGSVARHLGASSVGILLSGMGRDGASGLDALRRAGAFTIVQEPNTCVVASMPAAGIELGAARAVASPEEIMRIVGSIRMAVDA